MTEQQDKDHSSQHFADVMLPVPIPRTFTYQIPESMQSNAQVGSRVIVSFGKQKIQTGIIGKVHQNAPEKYVAKSILEVMDDFPVIHPAQIKLYRWMAGYYMCTLGEVLNVAIPSGLKLSSESYVQRNPEYDAEHLSEQLSDNEFRLLELLRDADQLSYRDISSLLGIKNIYNVLRSLTDKKAVLIFEQIKEKYKPKKEKYIRLHEQYLSPKEALETLFQALEKKTKQLEVILAYLRDVPALESEKANSEGLKKSILVSKGISESSLKTLIQKNILVEEDRIVSRFQLTSTTREAYDLTTAQSNAYDEIKLGFEQYDTVLLKGVTGSGKTEIYIKLIQEQLAENRQVLYLLPEIALTTQIVSRLKKIFGDLLGVYHSKYSDNERVEVWLGLLRGDYQVIVGVRSAIFLPFNRLGLIIVDEEYESTFKQFEPSPRYQARDVAIMLAKLNAAKTLLGTATPSFESYLNAKEGKYGYVDLPNRYKDIQMPAITLIDIKAQRKKKLMKNEFSETLLDEITATLEAGEQVIVFQNRRGYAPLLSCEQCGHIPKCHQCSVSLTYHQFGQELRCHYCGFREPLPDVCEACGSAQIKTMGFGTERLEENLNLFFPQATVSRMDLDTTRSKYGYQNILEEFEHGKVDILVGTQMVSKGLDFDSVGLVAVIDADRMIHYPDFRSHEKAFQLITQVSGRAGRREKQGKVFVQTYDPEQNLLKAILQNDYEGFYNEEIQEREKYHYPPYYRLVKIVLRHKDAAIVSRAAHYCAQQLTTELGKHRVLGPEEPLIARIRNLYHQVINVKLEKQGIDLGKAKEVIQRLSWLALKHEEYSGTSIYFDVDPF